MHIRRFFYSIALAALMPACVPMDQLIITQEQYETKECVGLGFKPGTDAFANCRLQLRAIDVERSKAQAMTNQGGYAPVYYTDTYDYPPPAHYPPHAHYVRGNVRPLNKGEHFINEYGQLCKMTHGKNIKCK